MRVLVSVEQTRCKTFGWKLFQSNQWNYAPFRNCFSLCFLINRKAKKILKNPPTLIFLFWAKCVVIGLWQRIFRVKCLLVYYQWEEKRTEKSRRYQITPNRGLSRTVFICSCDESSLSKCLPLVMRAALSFCFYQFIEQKKAAKW